jgi:hypothetical protein
MAKLTYLVAIPIDPNNWKWQGKINEGIAWNIVLFIETNNKGMIKIFVIPFIKVVQKLWKFKVYEPLNENIAGWALRVFSTRGYCKANTFNACCIHVIKQLNYLIFFVLIMY